MLYTGAEEVGHDFAECHRHAGNVLFLLIQRVAWAYIAAYGKRALIRIGDQSALTRA